MLNLITLALCSLFLVAVWKLQVPALTPNEVEEKSHRFLNQKHTELR
jgi:hypothetical protein